MLFDRDSASFRKSSFVRPRLRDGEIVVKVVCCTICGSDLHTYTGKRNGPSTSVLGHEIVGKICGWGGEKAPSDYHGNAISIGQRITWTLAVGCGCCFFCENKLSQKCKSLFKYGHESVSDRGATGGLSEYCHLVPGTSIFPLHESLSNHVACPANCATATVAAAIRLAVETHTIQDATILITGLGMLGLTASAMLAAKGAGHIIAIDANPERLKLAVSFGATHCIPAGDQALLASTTRRCSMDRGVDIAFDFAGVTPAVQVCIDSLRVGGSAILAGSVFPTDKINISPEEIVRRMITIRGIHNYLPTDLAAAIDFLTKNQSRFPFDALVSQVFSLDEVHSAFEFAAKERPVRVAVVPNLSQ